MNPINTFWSKTEKTESCWNWKGAKINDYGIMHVNDKIVLSHRFSYTYLVGDIPKNMEIHHLCKNRSCVNPDHLEVVTHKQNMMVTNNLNRQKTHCPKGHEYTKTNTLIKIGNKRACRKCNNMNKPKKEQIEVDFLTSIRIAKLLSDNKCQCYVCKFLSKDVEPNSIMKGGKDQIAQKIGVVHIDTSE